MWNAESDWSLLARMNEISKIKRVSFLKYFWVAHVKDELNVDLPFQTKAEFSYAMSVMDKIGGWDEGDEQEDQIGERFGANLWIYTNAVSCIGQRNMEKFVMNKMNSMTVAVNGAQEILYYNHEWTPQYSIVLQECKVLGRMTNSWFRAWCSGGCCGTRLRQASTMICTTMVSFARLTTMLSIWPSQDALPFLSVEDTTEDLLSWKHRS